ncbi:VCBS repeat-containing protein [Mucilaginibacter rubeus]|uniref:VCBS repeat-containing protein n=1 Tax=Mucilaginibacter rubeus TaxID=2027860 RepID=A0AAE6JF75_9SPHI|nr:MULTISPECIES: VCBS repeat-containing protein [Mucilaginibacter]QEM04483.1 VCBS repeat-containing protein [Mucilaginibacter rubeus]QEM17078.1 VCBS repeat-containing protein [Mucilaginibacter gossypii]QTE46421.1 VCBS repeat-containing protein [Mucilaginibacter rubeus]QTE53018.1 VCBS repeat-containing protein [Mucilaginibacter rubeus]QTE58105.1 VCBS repeat-containing protein [Mucilaginibacter rubeus]
MKKILSIVILCSSVLFSCKKASLFQQVSSSHSGIHFKNEIIENDSINPLDLVNIYNGGGVGIGDFNGDGLPDLYFTGNMVASKLYLNKGDFKFDDITDAAGVNGAGRWGRGVAVVDINNDGLPDIYVCNTITKDSLKRRNILYVNQGKGNDGIPHFKDEAAEYGLEAGAQSTMASFFDYDNDGDLDMYLTVNSATASYNPNLFGNSNYTANHSRGRLYRNDWDEKLHHGVFHDVSAQAGINLDGYGHAATTVDFNNDGWKDIYVSDDFISNNILYINNHDGTFTNRTKEYFKHTSYNAMGQDVIDINNDGLPDVVELDMSPEDNYRKKMILGPNSYQTYQNFDIYGTQYQYVRNTLQLNQGPRLGQNGAIGAPAFSEIGFLSGIAQTDWSWTPLITDFNNDGYRDMIITNGFPKDVSDHDFMTYREQAYAVTSKQKVLDQIPEIKLHNYAFANNGNLTFTDVSKDWGLSLPTFSNGAVYVDLDNDGAMDMVVNNINDEALVYRNTSRDDKNKLDKTHYLQITFKGDKQNINGLGATAEIFYDKDKTQVYENDPYRGYISSVQSIAHFGLGKINTIDSVLIKWPNGKREKLAKLKADQLIKVDIKNANDPYSLVQPQIAANALFKEITDSIGGHYTNKGSGFLDFNIQKLLPHKLSEYNPALAVGDIDGNGFDDLIIGGTAYDQAQVFFQMPDGKFNRRNLLTGNINAVHNFQDEGLLLFDANGDGKLDLYAASGGYEFAANGPEYQDRLYINDGKGNFTLATDALPSNLTSKLCVRACDYNKDGKPDLFVSGRVEPWKYPNPVSSFILRNDSENGHAKFTDVTAQVAPALKNIGMICDALFTDYDNDGWPDLVMAGEWMPVTFLKNEHGKFVNTTAQSGLGNKLGWWNSLVAGDFRHTGRTDYIVGNLGENSLIKASDQYPVYITAKEFDKSGIYSAIPSIFLPDQNGDKKEYPMYGRDDMLKQMISMRKKFTNYRSYALATMDEVLSPEQRSGALRLKANTLQSCFLRNDGNGKFTATPLPVEAQVSVLNGMETGDFDGDGNLDVVINGNDYGSDATIGRYDALNGLMLKGDGKGNFKPLSIMQSGIYIPGDGKALVKFRDKNGQVILAASQHKDVLKVFRSENKTKTIPVKANDVYALIKYKNGHTSRQEFYFGSSFLSQSARFIQLNDKILSVTVFDDKGNQRLVN